MDSLSKQLKYIRSCPDYKVFAIDLFCGAGGETTGIEQARLNGEKCAKVIACVNHDPNAIKSHASNHPDTLHYIEDIRTLNLGGLEKLVKTTRECHPQSFIMLHASLECTNFSKAKGGQPRDADSRTLAEHLFRYIEAIEPDYIQIENVEEFMCWGDLDKNGHPVSKDRGRCYMKWVNDVVKYGYHYDFRLLNAADFGAYTSRKRFFGMFAKNGLGIVFPTQTHSKKTTEGGLFEPYSKWRPVRDVLDLNDEGESIFSRKKALCEKTLERIYAGLIKFVAGGKDAFLVKYNSMNSNKQYAAPGIDEPCPTVACQNRLGLAKVQFLSKQFSGDPNGKNISLDAPCGTVTCKDHHALASAQFIDAYYGNGHEHSIEEPAPVLKTVGHLALVSSHFMTNEYSGGGQLSSIEEPNPAVLTTPKQKMVSVHQYLMNPQYQSAGGSVDNPCFTLIARMDKMPPYLISTKDGVGIAIYENDTPMTKKIKEFMALYGIVDVCMRMLKVNELKKIMGFPEDYVLVGTQSEQKKFIGNAVEVNMGRVLCEALCSRLAS